MDYVFELALWTAGSIVLLVIGKQLSWVAAQQPQSSLGRFRTGWAGNPFGRAFVFLVRFVYYLGIPYVVLLRHALSLVVVGLLGAQTAELPGWTLGWPLADWAGAMGWITGLGGIAAVTSVMGWWNARRALGADFPPGGVWVAPSFLVVARESIYLEVHWAFYRAAPLVLISDPYWASLVGAGLVIVEWLLDPSWWFGIADGPEREALLMQIGWLALSTAVFVMTHNVWPMLLLHVVLAWAVGKWVALLASQRYVVNEG
jgi:hypothetical protein